MKGNAKILTVLNSLLADELTVINQYMVVPLQNSVRIKNN
jgi:bacterioferritin (cytochrome b1)